MRKYLRAFDMYLDAWRTQDVDRMYIASVLTAAQWKTCVAEARGELPHQVLGIPRPAR